MTITLQEQNAACWPLWQGRIFRFHAIEDVAAFFAFVGTPRGLRWRHPHSNIGGRYSVSGTHPCVADAPRWLHGHPSKVREWAGTSSDVVHDPVFTFADGAYDCAVRYEETVEV